MIADFTILMTACIDPAGASGQVQRTDPALRLGDYQAALRYWLTTDLPGLRNVVIVENSGYPLDGLRAVADELAGVEVLFVQTDDNFVPEGFTYAFPEVKMLQHVAAEQEVWDAVAPHVVKVTGRLTFPGLACNLRDLPADTLFCGDMSLRRDIWKFWAMPQYITTQMFIVQKNLLATEIAELWRSMRPEPGHRLFENVIARYALELRAREGTRVRLRYPCNADPVGVTAWNDQATAGTKRNMVGTFRATVRNVLPWWWV